MSEPTRRKCPKFCHCACHQPAASGPRQAVLDAAASLAAISPWHPAFGDLLSHLTDAVDAWELTGSDDLDAIRVADQRPGAQAIVTAVLNHYLGEPKPKWLQPAFDLYHSDIPGKRSMPDDLDAATGGAVTAAARALCQIVSDDDQPWCETHGIDSGTDYCQEGWPVAETAVAAAYPLICRTAAALLRAGRPAVRAETVSAADPTPDDLTRLLWLIDDAGPDSYLKRLRPWIAAACEFAARRAGGQP